MHTSTAKAYVGTYLCPQHYKKVNEEFDLYSRLHYVSSLALEKGAVRRRGRGKRVRKKR
jgi:hypothetical protein